MRVKIKCLFFIFVIFLTILLLYVFIAENNKII